MLLAFVIPFSGGGEGTPSYKLQKALHVPVGYFIVPLFALANNGIVLHQGWLAEMAAPNSAGIIVGLVVGKPVGILLSCWLLVRFSTVSLPVNIRWQNMAGAAVLAGIGFTMSIFISNLAFGKSVINKYAKVTVLLASAISATAGLVILLRKKT